MSSPSNTAQSNSSGAWTEPPWCGWIETTGDALLILEAARRGIIPRVTRRLVDSERKMITSGSVFVFDEDESGIKRWTDGFFWSPSRILGNFLLYRETDKRGAGHRGLRSEPSDYSDSPQHGVKVEDASLSRPKSEVTRMGIDKHRERTLVGSLTNSYKFKPDGLMKKTFSLTIGGVSQHLISYYKIEDVEQGRLRPPSSIPELAALDISPEYLDKTHFRNPPKVEIGLDGIPRYRGEADEIDLSPRLYPPLSTGVPLLTEGRVPSPSSEAGSAGGAGKRTKRFDPYTPGGTKRTRKPKNGQNPDSSPIDQPTSSPDEAGPQHSSHFPEPSGGMSHYPHASAPYGVGPYSYYQATVGYGASSPHTSNYPTSPYSQVSSLASPSATSPASPHAHDTPPTTPQTSYSSSYGASSSSSEVVPQPGPSGPSVYSYYSTSYGHYPAYAGAPAWQHYNSYPPPHMPHHATITTTVVSTPAPGHHGSSGSSARIEEVDTGVDSEDAS